MAYEKELVDFVSKLAGVETQLAVLGSEVKSGFAAIESKLKVIFAGDSKKCLEQDAKIIAIEVRVKANEDIHTDESKTKKGNYTWIWQFVVAFALLKVLDLMANKLYKW